MSDSANISAAVKSLATNTDAYDDRDATQIIPTSGHVGHQPDRYPELNSLCFEFLEKIKRNFGQHSQQSATIHSVLDGFQGRGLSKREAYFVIFDQLGSDDELKADLQAILEHADARWDPRDFQQEHVHPLSVPQVVPQFLQPQHQPQLPMPHVSSFWNTNLHTQSILLPQPSINPVLLHNQKTTPHKGGQDTDSFLMQDLNEPPSDPYGYHGLYQPVFPNKPESCEQSHSPASLGSPSSASQITNAYPTFDLEQLPTVQCTQTSAPSSYTDVNYDLLASPVRGLSYPPQRSPSLHEDWNKIQLKDIVTVRQPENVCGLQTTTLLSNHDTIRPLAFPSQRSLDATLLVDAPLMNSSGILFGIPQFKKAIESASFVSTQQSEHQKIKKNSPSPVQFGSLFAVPSVPSNISRSSGKHQRYKGQFVHAICGKTFTTRHAVKKHHWGQKMNDEETTTGCWFNNGKPNVDWNDHPSCREPPKPPKTARMMKRESPHSKQKNVKAPTAPSMLPESWNTVPATLSPDGTMKGSIKCLQRPPSIPQLSIEGDTLQYHSHKLPNQRTHGRLNTLLTIVNAASLIDAPAPQGLNDSVVSRLDAKVAASELQGRHTPSWFEDPYDRHSTPLEYTHDLPPPRAIGLGIIQGDHELHRATDRVTAPRVKELEVVTPATETFLKTHTRSDNIDGELGNEILVQHTSSDERQSRQNKWKRDRRRSRTGGISKKELRGLGLEVSPNPEMKRRRGGNGEPSLKETVQPATVTRDRTSLQDSDTSRPEDVPATLSPL